MSERHVHFDMDEETWIRARQRAAQEGKSVDRVIAELLQLYAARTQDPFVDVKAVKEEIRRRRERSAGVIARESSETRAELRQDPLYGAADRRD
jgi:hypothetical protein